MNYDYNTYADVQAATKMFTNSFILIVLGIIGEYIARIYEQVKNRPNYILKNKNDKQH